MIFLPYADDIRHLADIRKPADPVPEEYLDLASEFIDKLEIKNYRVDNYENPGLFVVLGVLAGDFLFW